MKQWDPIGQQWDPFVYIKTWNIMKQCDPIVYIKTWNIMKQWNPIGQQFWLYLKNTILYWPEDGRLTAEACRQI